ncbi:MAG: hypothetical protein O3A29_02925 [Planctomycetota bacterium]|nr:hypothetical protein [Planctomycetota bacterium]
MKNNARKSPPLPVDRLQQQLTEKEEVIAALTAQLEQAADELDRRHRSGHDRGMTVTGGGSGFPPELIEHQKAVTDELHAAVERWDEMQVSLTLGRLEMQLLEIRDLITGTELPTASHNAVDRSPSKKAKSEPDWESIKSQFIDAPGDESLANPAPPALDEKPVDNEPSACRTSDNGAEIHARPMQDWEAEIPVPVDIESADTETLKNAIEIRDIFIVELTQRLRSIPIDAPPRNWDGLIAVPEELQRGLEAVRTRYDEKLRCAEIELSLERARLGREEARLLELKESLEQQLKRHGHHPQDHASAHAANENAHVDSPDKSSLWRLLGKK